MKCEKCNSSMSTHPDRQQECCPFLHAKWVVDISFSVTVRLRTWLSLEWSLPCLPGLPLELFLTKTTQSITCGNNALSLRVSSSTGRERQGNEWTCEEQVLWSVCWTVRLRVQWMTHTQTHFEDKPCDCLHHMYSLKTSRHALDSWSDHAVGFSCRITSVGP